MTDFLFIRSLLCIIATLTLRQSRMASQLTPLWQNALVVRIAFITAALLATQLHCLPASANVVVKNLTFNVNITSSISGILYGGTDNCSGNCGGGTVYFSQTIYQDQDQINSITGILHNAFPYIFPTFGVSASIEVREGNISAVDLGWIGGEDGPSDLAISYSNGRAVGSEALGWEGGDSNIYGTEIEFSGRYIYQEQVFSDSGQLISEINVVPEPATWAMFTLGLVGLGLGRYRANRKSVAVAT